MIKPADKGEAMIIMDKKMYLKEINTQLSDDMTYQWVLTNPTTCGWKTRHGCTKIFAIRENWFEDIYIFNKARPGASSLLCNAQYT